MGSIRSICGLFLACSPGCKICINTRSFFSYHAGLSFWLREKGSELVEKGSEERTQ